MAFSSKALQWRRIHNLLADFFFGQFSNPWGTILYLWMIVKFQEVESNGIIHPSPLHKYYLCFTNQNFKLHLNTFWSGIIVWLRHALLVWTRLLYHEVNDVYWRNKFGYRCFLILCMVRKSHLKTSWSAPYTELFDGKKIVKWP